MERFPTLTTCPECREPARAVALSAAGFTRCPDCSEVYLLTADALEQLATVALVNLPGGVARRVIQEAGAMLSIPTSVAPRVGAVGPVAGAVCDGRGECEDAEWLAGGKCLRCGLTRAEPDDAPQTEGDPMLAEALSPELVTLHAVCDRLRAAGLEVSIECPGFILTANHAEDGAHWSIGSDNDTWGGNLTSATGADVDAFATDVPSTSTDADAITAAILAPLREYCRECGELLTVSSDGKRRGGDLCHDCARIERAALRSRGER